MSLIDGFCHYFLHCVYALKFTDTDVCIGVFITCWYSCFLIINLEELKKRGFDGKDIRMTFVKSFHDSYLILINWYLVLRKKQLKAKDDLVFAQKVVDRSFEVKREIAEQLKQSSFYHVLMSNTLSFSFRKKDECYFLSAYQGPAIFLFKSKDVKSVGTILGLFIEMVVLTKRIKYGDLTFAEFEERVNTLAKFDRLLDNPFSEKDIQTAKDIIENEIIEKLKRGLL